MVLSGKLTQNEQDVIFVSTVYNPTLVTLDASIYEPNGEIGEYEITASADIFDVNLPPRWYVSDNMGSRYAVVAINPNKLKVQAYDNTGNPMANNLNGVWFES